MDFEASVCPIRLRTQEAERPSTRQQEKAYDGSAVLVVEQAVRGLDLLFFTPTQHPKEDGRGSLYLSLLRMAVLRLFDAWRERQYLLALFRKGDATACPVCLAAETSGAACNTSMFSSQQDSRRCEVLRRTYPPCTACANTNPPLLRVLLAATFYVHKLLMAGVLTNANMEVALVASLLVSLKVQMPVDVSWGVSLTIMLVTGKNLEGSANAEHYSKMREEVIFFEHKLLQVVGERGVRCLLPTDFIQSDVAKVVALMRKSSAGNADDRSNAVLAAYVESTLDARAAFILAKAHQLEVLCLETPLLCTCDAREISSALVYLAWRLSCETTAEVEAGDSAVLTSLDVACGAFATFQHVLSSMAGQKPPTSSLNPIPENSVRFLIASGLVTQGDELYFGDVCTADPRPVATISFTEVEDVTWSNGGTDRAEGGAGGTNPHHSYRFVPLRAPGAYFSLKGLTAALFHDTVAAKAAGAGAGAGRVEAEAEKVQRANALRERYGELTEHELLDVWRVRRGRHLFKLRALYKGWVRVHRYECLDNVLKNCGAGGGSHTSLVYPNALYEVLFWLTWVSAKKDESALCNGLCRVGGEDTATFYLSLIARAHFEAGVLRWRSRGSFRALFEKTLLPFLRSSAEEGDKTPLRYPRMCAANALGIIESPTHDGAVVATLTKDDEVECLFALPQRRWAFVEATDGSARGWCRYSLSEEPQTSPNAVDIDMRSLPLLNGAAATSAAADAGAEAFANPEKGLTPLCEAGKNLLRLGLPAFTADVSPTPSPSPPPPPPPPPQPPQPPQSSVVTVDAPPPIGPPPAPLPLGPPPPPLTALPMARPERKTGCSSEPMQPMQRPLQRYGGRQPTPNLGPNAMPYERPPPQLPGQAHGLRGQTCVRCNKEGHAAHECSGAPVCRQCGAIGHMANRCPSRGREALRNPGADPRDRSRDYARPQPVGMSGMSMGGVGGVGGMGGMGGMGVAWAGGTGGMGGMGWRGPPWMGGPQIPLTRFLFAERTRAETELEYPAECLKSTEAKNPRLCAATYTCDGIRKEFALLPDTGCTNTGCMFLHLTEAGKVRLRADLHSRGWKESGTSLPEKNP